MLHLLTILIVSLFTFPLLFSREIAAALRFPPHCDTSYPPSPRCVGAPLNCHPSLPRRGALHCPQLLNGKSPFITTVSVTADASLLIPQIIIVKNVQNRPSKYKLSKTQHSNQRQFMSHDPACRIPQVTVLQTRKNPCGWRVPVSI